MNAIVDKHEAARLLAIAPNQFRWRPEFRGGARQIRPGLLAAAIEGTVGP